MADDNENTPLESAEATQISTPEGQRELTSMEAAFEAAQTAPGALKDGDIPDEELPARERAENGQFKAKERREEKAKEQPKKEDKPEASKEGPTADKKPANEEDAERESDEDVRRELKGKMHPKKLDAILAARNELRAQVKTLKGQLAERDTALTQAKKTTPLSDDERKELKRLQDYEFMHDPERSGRITREFDDKLKKLDGEIYSLLTWMPATKAEAQSEFDAAKEKGGLPEGAQPRLSVEELAAAKGGVASIAYNDWESQVFRNQAIDGRTRQKLEKAINEHFDLTEGRQRAIEEAPKDRESYERQQGEASKAQTDKYNGQLREEAAKLTDTLGEWAKERTLPDNATAAQKSEVEAHNKLLKDKLYPAFVSNLAMETPEKHVRVAMGVGSPVAIHWQAEAERLQAALDAAEERAQKAEERYSGVRQAGKISRAVQSPAKASPRNFMREDPNEAFDRAQEVGAKR